MAIDIILILTAIILSIVGILGCIVPGLPGPPLNYISMLIIQYQYQSFSYLTLIVFGILTALILVIDYILPIWFAKKFGATKQGIWGSVIGMVAGMFLTPIGMILGILLGAIIGDLIAGRTTSQASKSGLATFTGTLMSIGLKLMISGTMLVLVVIEIISKSI